MIHRARFLQTAMWAVVRVLVSAAVWLMAGLICDGGRVATAATRSSAPTPEVAPVAVRIDNAEGWVGQRMSVFIELRAAGSFSGTASFDLPQLPGTTVLKIGSPVVSTQQLEGDSWFVQTHEFALFSQRTGVVRVPPFPVRYSKRDDFTGPVEDTVAQCPAFEVTLKRPPGSEAVPFLITTHSFQVSETWTPEPGPADFGAIFKRTIVQTSQQIPGMALQPAPASAEAGIRVYPGEMRTNDSLQRGEFKGERSETITYMLQKSGEVELPGITYVWWDPKTETLEQTTLPPVRVVVGPKPVADVKEPVPSQWGMMAFIVVLIMGLAVAVLQRQRLWSAAEAIRQWWNPPTRVAARALREACVRNDARAANLAWMQWRALQSTDYQPEKTLADAVLVLQQSLFGPTPAPWTGQALQDAFQKQSPPPSQPAAAALPPLNPAAVAER